MLEKNARDIGPHTLALVVAIMDRNPNPEFDFRSCYGVLRLANGHHASTAPAATPWSSALARLIDLAVRGWMNYYGRFYRSKCVQVLRSVNVALARATEIQAVQTPRTRVHALAWPHSATGP